LPFSDAEAACKAQGAHLVTVDDDEENIYIASNFPAMSTSFNNETKSALMLGLNSFDQPGQSKFTWVGNNSRNSILYTNFVNPYLVKRPDDCVYMLNVMHENSGGLWETFGCNFTGNFASKKGFVCQKNFTVI
jgi:hypothetical protein